jgi:hypothetical protein
MTEAIESSRPFRITLDDGAVVESTGGTLSPAYSDAAVPELVLRLPAFRAHRLAHLLDDWSRALGLAPPAGWAATDRPLSRTLEAAAAALGDPDAGRCMSRALGEIGAQQRMAALTVLQEREPALSATQRIATIDAAARWMNEDAGDELAFALLAAVCRSDVTTNQVYLALLSPPPEPERGGDD